jgi:hypothetical protein
MSSIASMLIGSFGYCKNTISFSEFRKDFKDGKIEMCGIPSTFRAIYLAIILISIAMFAIYYYRKSKTPTNLTEEELSNFVETSQMFLNAGLIIGFPFYVPLILFFIFVLIKLWYEL